MSIEETIENAISDSQSTPEVEISSTPEVASEAPESTPVEVEASSDPTPTEVSETPTEAPLFLPDETPEPTQAATPATRAAAPVQKEQDDFEKKYGIQRESVPGRENRIPYSRVVKITAKAAADAKSEAQKEWEPKYQALETQVKDYESRFIKVAKFEDVMLNDKETFLKRLATVPGYSELLAPIFQPQAQAPIPPVQVPVAGVDDPMPQPDQEFPDGTVGYSVPQLEKLNAWNRSQAAKEVLEQVNKIYGPIREREEQQQKIREAEPVVHKQIQEAYSWPMFKENEDEITAVLVANKHVDLRGAYQHVVLPKIMAQAQATQTNEAALRQKIRAEVLAELKKAPASTSAPTRPVSYTTTQSQGGPKKTIEEIIAERVATIRQ